MKNCLNQAVCIIFVRPQEETLAKSGGENKSCYNITKLKGAI